MSERVSSSLQFQRGVHRGLRTLAREGRIFSSLLTVAALLLLLGLLLLTFLGIEMSSDVLRSNSTLRLEIERTASAEQTQDLYRALQDQPGIMKTELITKDQAYQAVRQRDPSVVSFIDAFGLQNPFPDTITVTLSSVDVYAGLLRFLQEPRWQGIVAPEFLARAASQEEQLTEVLRVTETGSQATFVILSVTAATLLLALISLLHRRILQRSADTQTQLLLGAGPGDLFVPLWTETTILLLGGLLLAAGALAGLSFALPSLLPSAGQSTFVQSVSTSLWPVLLDLGPIVLGIAIATTPVVAAFATLFGLTSQPKFGFLHRSHA